MNFGKAIRQYRTEADISQRKLAQLIRVTPTYISHLESGRAEPSITLLRKIARVLEVPEEILFWEAVEIPSNIPERDLKVCNLALKIVKSWRTARKVN